jgi:hypothetical protein
MTTETIEVESDDARRTGSKFVAEAVLVVLKERGIDVPDDIRAEIEGCADLDQQFRWLRRAARHFPVHGFWAQWDAEKWAVAEAKVGTDPEMVAMGLARRLIGVFASRGVAPVLSTCLHIYECRDHELLLEWIGRAVVAEEIGHAIDFTKLPRLDFDSAWARVRAALDAGL